MTAMTATNSDKAARGTKRTCQACEVRFYDLLRDPIVCPSCGALYELAVQVPADVGVRKSAGRAGWRHSAKRVAQVEVEPAQDAAIAASAETDGTEDIEVASDEVSSPSFEDETVLIEPDDESDFAAELVENPKQR